MDYTGRELFFDKNDLIVSKTDTQGKLTYTNDIFLEIAGYTEAEVMGKPHNVIRNPNMPRAIFDLLWKTISAGEEIFAYVVNSAKNGDHYWVIAHVTPSRENGEIIGYHSTRRVPNHQVIRDVIEPLYDQLRALEQSATNRKAGLEKSMGALRDMLSNKGQSYNEFISDLMRG
ncbi:PAS domain S-box protein [Kordiimonas sp. SCSIO 12603]|uniref:PAS domain-containing protein n=1 Tax=Kordiimonas sp. SCSIO 12603 TaxID=2829596 RepID=UPI002105058C|nr:PAS domain S-box protein [Kordiimonas sp. SCSIO 12603]UTW59862.1 PAS domain S-box protein [Kordiimonas sp. SCSIO 12603]